MLAVSNFLWAVCGAVFRPLANRPQLALLIFSVITAGLAMLVWKYASNQKAITRAKDHIKANFLAMVLYMDSLGVLLSSIGKTFAWTFAYIGRQIVPLIIMMVPILPLLVQVDHLYSFSPLVAGAKNPAATAQVVVTVDKNAVNLDDTTAELTASGGVEVETKAVRIAHPRVPRSPWEDKLLVGSLAHWFAPSEDQLSPEIRWNVKATAPGSYELTVKVGDATATKKVVVAAPGDTKKLWQIARKRHDGNFGDALGYPGESKLTGPIQSIEVVYPRKDGWWHWIVIYLIETIIVAFALKGPMKVDF